MASADGQIRCVTHRTRVLVEQLRGGAEGPSEGPRLPDELSVQADMERQHMEHITQETRRWYAMVLSVFICVFVPSRLAPRSEWCACRRPDDGGSVRPGQTPRGGLAARRAVMLPLD